MVALKQFDNLNTSYVNLAALLRYLREQNFSGSIHVVLDEYEAEIFLAESGSAAVFEIDRISGVPAQEEGAMERALVHAREPGGTITVYEGKTQPGSATGAASESSIPGFADPFPTADAAPAEQVDWDDHPFLDPTASNFKYANGTVTLGARPATSAYVTGLSECLRRIVNKLAIDKEGKRFRERVAVELALAARLRPLGDFQLQLDKIAGTRVL